MISLQNTPQATILMPLRDEAQYIKACLDSIRTAASFVQVEVIAIDDHSADQTAKIIADYVKTHPNFQLHLVYNPGRGKAAALNYGYTLARGDVLVFLAGDDLLVADMLPARITAVSNNEQPTVATCRYLTTSDQPQFDGILLPRPGHVHQVAGGTASFNRAFAQLYFPIPETLPNEDSWMRAIMMMFQVRHHRLEDVGLMYRVHSGNSMGMSYDFATNTKAIADRAQAYSLAMQHKNATDEGRLRLAPMVAAEKLRQQGRWYKIPFLRGLPRGDKLVAIVNTNLWLYNLKKQISRILSLRIR